MIVTCFFTDHRRYQIRNCLYNLLHTVHLGGQMWQLTAPVTFSWTWDLGDAAITCPAGYRWDGASIPRLGRIAVDPIMAFDGSLVHDIGYETQGGWRKFQIWDAVGGISEADLLDSKTCQPLVIDGDLSNIDSERRRARFDALLRYFWITSGMPVRMADDGYAAVRAGGHSAWQSTEPPILAQIIPQIIPATLVLPVVPPAVCETPG